MKQQYFSNVWFADEKRIRSMTKMLVFSDKGSLKTDDNLIEFQGKRAKVRIAKIRQISIARQQLSWISILITNIFMIVWLAVLGMQLPSGSFLTTTSLFWYLILALLGGDAFAVIVGYSTKWIKIEYGVEEKSPCFAYLADGSVFGWGGIFGGTEKLYQKIKTSETHL